MIRAIGNCSMLDGELNRIMDLQICGITTSCKKIDFSYPTFSSSWCRFTRIQGLEVQEHIIVAASDPGTRNANRH